MSLERFSREIQLAASLQQANIVPLLAAGSADGVPYFTMPFVPGESLRTRLRTVPDLTVPECVGILRDVARALSYAHARGVVHRDIKPDNVLLSHGAAVVTDFGIAKAVSAARTQGAGATLTQAGTSIGTPSYMAPEQIAGDGDVGPRADLYSWGCLAYELLAGEPPFVRENAQRTMAAHLAEAPRALGERQPALPPPLARLVMRCLEKDQQARPTDADAVLRELDAVLTPSSVPPESPVRRGATGGRATRGRLVLAALSLGVVGLTAWLSVRERTGTARGTARPAAEDPAGRSVAVLPLTNLGGEKSDDYFGIGLAEEMTRALAKTGVRVIGRTSAASLLAKGLDERAVARELGVSSMLTGTVQRAAGQIRINVSLLAASDGAVQWTEKYDRPIANIFAVQDEIALAVAGKLGGALAEAGATAGGGTGERSARMETADPEAYAQFLQAQVLFNRRSAESLTQAIAILEAMAKRNPAFARGHALLAMAYAISGNYILNDTDARYAKAMMAAQRAIAMDATIAEAYAAIGWVRGAQGRLGEADRALERALALDSTLATAWGWQGLHLSWRGRIAEGHRYVARAQALEPASLVVRTWDAQIHLYDRKHAAADSVASIVVRLDSTFAPAWMAKAEALLGLGRTREAVAIMQRRVALLPALPATEYHGMLAYALARAGDTTAVRATLDRLRQGRTRALPPLGSIAVALLEIGERAEALEVMQRAIALHDPWTAGFIGNARYDRMRKDSQGAVLLATVLTR
ncbi:MAG: protein kinase [Gemmatimonadaceae bacterium]|nr:protein kinase [Gemmatimonadaceae bacterium]